MNGRDPYSTALSLLPPVVAIVLLVAMLFQIFRPMPKHAWTDEDETNTASAAVSA